MKDVELVDKLESKMGLITLALTVAYKGGVNYNDTFGVTSIWDSIIYRSLNSQKTVAEIETNPDRVKTTFAGAYVKDPQVGIHDWVVSFDLNSLYPNLIVEYNMSPETLVHTGEDFKSNVDYYLNKGRVAIICYDFAEHTNIKSGLDLTIRSKEFQDWLNS